MKKASMMLAAMVVASAIAVSITALAAGGGADYGRGPETDPVASVYGTNAQARVAVLETNTATKAQGVAATNAQARVAVLEGAINGATISAGTVGTNALDGTFYTGQVVGVATGTYSRGLLISIP